MTLKNDQERHLAVRLREETTGAHNEAENSDFMSRLLGGELDRQAAIDLTSQLLFRLCCSRISTACQCYGGAG